MKQDHLHLLHGERERLNVLFRGGGGGLGGGSLSIKNYIDNISWPFYNYLFYSLRTLSGLFTLILNHGVKSALSNDHRSGMKSISRSFRMTARK
jgi:hypothetical protein